MLMNRLSLAGMVILTFSAAASADYVLAPVPQGGGPGPIAALPGDSFIIDMVLTSDGGDQVTSCDFFANFDMPGLKLVDSGWHHLPFETTPFQEILPAPGGSIAGQVSFNTFAADSFTEGPVAWMKIEVPMGFSAPLVTVSPETIRQGFFYNDVEIPATAGSDLQIIIPEPVTLSMMAAGALALIRRRRRL